MTSRRLGDIDSGFFDTLKVLDKGGASASAPGRSASAARRSRPPLRYAKERVQFGKSLSRFQAIQHMLADAGDRAGRRAAAGLRRAAWMQGPGAAAPPRSRRSPSAHYAARAAVRACNAAVQIHGGNGFVREFPVERYLRDAKLAEIGEGTNGGPEDGDRARELLRTAAEQG